jgi:apolipoprotein N-acyltransferase
VSGVVFALTAPPTDAPLGLLAGLVGFALCMPPSEGEPRARRAVLVGLMFGLGANLVALRFVPEVITRFTSLGDAPAALALVLLSLAQGVPWLLGALAAHVLARRGVARWLAFAGGVYVATFVPAVFPWTPAGGLATWPWMIQLADVVGERGVSLLVAAATGLFADAVAMLRRGGATRRSSLVPLSLSVALLVGLALHGAARSAAVERSRRDAPHARVAVVQPLFEAFDRWEAERSAMMMERLTSLTLAAEKRGAELVVWPESAYPYPIPHALRRSPIGPRAVLGHGVRGPVLTGAYTTAARGESYNAAILARSDGSISRPYAKRHLLWFGETVPLSDTFPWLRRVFARGTGILPGDRQVLFEAGAVRAAVLNCYEDTLPVAGREAMEVEPNLLVNITNDAWFAGSAEGELHLRLSVLRAVEARRDMVRAVNAGPTSWVDAAGVVRLRYVGPVPAAPLTSPALLEGKTFYVRHGDGPFAALVALAAVTGALRARRRREAAAA